MGGVDTNISDLFFNRDLSHVKKYDRGEFVGYDDELLMVEAKDFLASIQRLSPRTAPIPTPEALIQDFFGRL